MCYILIYFYRFISFLESKHQDTVVCISFGVKKYMGLDCRLLNIMVVLGYWINRKIIYCDQVTFVNSLECDKTELSLELEG